MKKIIWKHSWKGDKAEGMNAMLCEEYSWVDERELNYDNYGRLLYHPVLHPNHKKPYTESELEYLCKYWEVDGMKTMGMAMGRPEHSLATKINLLRKDNLFDYYKNLNKHW